MTNVPVSRLYLPKLQSAPPTVFDYLVRHFPQIDASIWRSRISRGLVTMSDRTPLTEHSPYRHGIFVLYRKEVVDEPAVADEVVIVHRDDDILVVDKPHGVPVTPVGDHVERSLLVQMQKITNLATLAPVHRLDKETGGLVLFAIKPELRAMYHALFAEGAVFREYLALARMNEKPACRRWHIATRLAPGEPWFRQRIVDGTPNAITDIELVEVRDGLGLFRLLPKTGKKHQLRVHMASIGFPIIGDPYYPQITQKQDGAPPMQLVATRLEFVDPLTAERRSYLAQRKPMMDVRISGSA